MDLHTLVRMFGYFKHQLPTWHPLPVFHSFPVFHFRTCSLLCDFSDALDIPLLWPSACFTTQFIRFCFGFILKSPAHTALNPPYPMTSYRYIHWQNINVLGFDNRWRRSWWWTPVVNLSRDLLFLRQLWCVLWGRLGVGLPPKSIAGRCMVSWSVHPGWNMANSHQRSSDYPAPHPPIYCSAC